MLFSSYVFLFIFLPVTLCLYWMCDRFQWASKASFLVAASLVFYGYWEPIHVPLMVGSIIVNFFLAARLTPHAGHQRWLLTISIAFNLALLGLFKYSSFCLGEFSRLSGLEFAWPQLALPLGISFFTFQQIAYLVDCYQKKAPTYRPLEYAGFVLFFPQLIAGPIVHHNQLANQLRPNKNAWLRADHMAIGITVFVIGLFKKIAIADSMAPLADAGFSAVNGSAISAVSGWTATLAYTCQIYFDFSGYSDMAIGLGWMFSIKLPINFNSPYKATSIVDFWRRWHITLSTFLRDYLYFPLGGSRRGSIRRYVNLLTTMLLGGIWHGAGWNFIVWGGLHGAFLCVNHGWSNLTGRRQQGVHRKYIWMASSWLVTMLSVIAAWVVFRTETLAAASSMLQALTFQSNIPSLIDGASVQNLAIVVCVFLSCTFLPNTQQLMSGYLDEADKPRQSESAWAWATWRPNAFRGVMTAMLFMVAISLLTRVKTFLYFQF